MDIVIIVNIQRASRRVDVDVGERSEHWNTFSNLKITSVFRGRLNRTGGETRT